MQGFSWLIVIPIFVLCATIIGLYINSKQEKKHLTSPLLQFAISTDAYKHPNEMVKRQSINSNCLNGDFNNYIQ